MSPVHGHDRSGLSGCLPEAVGEPVGSVGGSLVCKGRVSISTERTEEDIDHLHNCVNLYDVMIEIDE